MKKETRDLNAPAIDLIADILDKHVDAILGEVRIRFKQIKSDQSSEPAEPVKRKRRYAQGTALGEFGIIPMCDQVDDEPVKVPSDAELEKAWDSFEAEMARHPTDDELEEFMAQFADEMGHIHSDQHAEAARAILARYGKGTP